MKRTSMNLKIEALLLNLSYELREFKNLIYLFLRAIRNISISVIIEIIIILALIEQKLNRFLSIGVYWFIRVFYLKS